MKVIRPFGPTIAKVKIPKEIIKDLNNYVDKIIENEKKLKDLDHGKKLAGNVKQEFILEKDFLVLSGWENFLKENTDKWIMESVKKKISEFNIISSWVVRQFSNEYNPIHYHSGHISGVGYLKLPEGFGQTVQEGKVNHNGFLELIHGSEMFLSPATLHIKPEVGDFYFFPNYLMHCVYPFQNTDDERRSISFNAKIDNNIYSLPDA
mgnify:CR=1 FL=1|tara:strand:- start:1304 stop:1924 length:621 start_codon:yes stop_codon:yes gene_type:complete